MKKAYFQKFTVRDVVFLAIISAVAVCTSAVMAIVAHTYIFGLAQLVTALQLSLFPAIALMKVRKPGTILFIALFTGVIELFMSPVMFFSSAIAGILCELLAGIIFRGFENDKAVFMASWLFVPLMMPLNIIYYRLFSEELFDAFFGGGLQMLAFIFVAGAIAVAALGAFLGVKISRELIRAGILRK